MPQSRTYYFIINPISGGRSKDETVQTIENLMIKNKVQYEIAWWNDGINVGDLVKKGVKKGFNTMVAVGGDGTINKVAAELVNSDLTLGILPTGSGNGFARHLGIKGHLDEQIRALLNGFSQKIDSGTCNGHFFINISGVGFDAHVSNLFAKSKKRGLMSYAKLSMIEARTYAEELFELELDGKKLEENAFLISIANGSQWGNEFYISPDSELNDGQLRCCLLKKPPLMAIPGLIRRFLTGEISESKYYKDIPFKKLVVKRQQKGAVHLDGEPMILENELVFEVQKNSINVIESKTGKITKDPK